MQVTTLRILIDHMWPSQCGAGEVSELPSYRRGSLLAQSGCEHHGKKTHSPILDLPGPWTPFYLNMLNSCSVFLWDHPMCQTEWVCCYCFNQNNADLSRYSPSAKHKQICNFSVFLLLDLKTQFHRTPYWYQLFHYSKWIYSCPQWQISTVSLVARCLASHLWGNHKPLRRELLTSSAIYKGFSRGQHLPSDEIWLHKSDGWSGTWIRHHPSS